MSVLALSFLAALALAFVEFMGEWWTRKLVMNRAWLSFAGGNAVAYVFLHLLPELGIEQARLGERLGDPPLAGYALYLAALVSLAAFFGLERACTVLHEQGRHPVGETILHFGSFAVYNAIIGYLTVQRAGLGIGTLLLFVAAIGLHSILNTHGLSQKHQEHLRVGRWVLSGAVLFGWGLGAVSQIPQTGQAFLFAFMAGGIILNVLKEELPAENQSRFGAFGMGLVFFAVVILVVAQFFPGAVGHSAANDRQFRTGREYAVNACPTQGLVTLDRSVRTTREMRVFAVTVEVGSGDGAGTEASFGVPSGLTILPDETYAFVAETNSHHLRLIDRPTGRVGTIALGG